MSINWTNTIIRAPGVVAGITTTVLGLEGVSKVVHAALKGMTRFTGEISWVKGAVQKVPPFVVTVLRPFKDLTVKQLAISAIACAVISTLSFNLAKRKDKEVDKNGYNSVLSYLGPVRIDLSADTTLGKVYNFIASQFPKAEGNK